MDPEHALVLAIPQKNVDVLQTTLEGAIRLTIPACPARLNQQLLSTKPAVAID